MPSPDASVACSKRYARFRAMGTKLERVIVSGNPMAGPSGEISVIMPATPGPAADTGPPHALIERRGHVLIVTMNRPEARNALSGPMMALMRQAWDEVDSDPEIRVAVLTGAGGAFCAGADLEAMNNSHPGDTVRTGKPDLSAAEALRQSR